MKAWLITWEWTGEAAAVADKVVGILNFRWSTRRVSDIVEFLYNECTSTLAEMSSYAKSPRKNPYRSKIDFNSRITCGHHPWLLARIVDDLQIIVDEQTRIETVSWKEVPIYEPTDEGPKESRGYLADRYMRRISGRISHELIWDRENGTYKDWWLKLDK